MFKKKIIRVIIQSKKTYSYKLYMKKHVMLGVGVTNQSEKEILEYIVRAVEKTREKFLVVTPNPEILVYAHHHKTFQNILNNAKISLADGIGVILAGKFLGKSFVSRVTGIDLLEKLCEAVSKKPITVGFLGAKPKVAELTAECLVSRYPNLKVVFASDNWSKEGFLVTNPRLEIRNSKLENKSLDSNFQVQQSSLQRPVSSIKSVDILFVAYGFPKQEEFMAQNLDKLPVRVMMGVGGAFDYISGQVPRAPKWLRSIGLEWLFRLFVQPWRLVRQLALLEFLWLILHEKVKS